MDSLPGPVLYAIVRKLVVEENMSHSSVSNVLKATFPHISRGLSTRTVRRYCAIHGISRTSRLKDCAVDRIVKTNICKVGPTYGRKCMTGLLAAQGFKVAEKRVGASLKKVCLRYHEKRVTATDKLLNPVPYRSRYFGEKIHLDQNEKLILFGVTHICAVDGHSGMIVGFCTMPVKNNIIIYGDLFRQIVIQYGLWDQVRVDHGREWYLLLAVQKSLADLRNNRLKAPYIQTSSKQNHIVERMWSEVNVRVNYPIKAILVHLMETGRLNVNDPLQLFCVSWLTIRVSTVGVELFVKSWNYHPIPGRRRGAMKAHVPEQIMRLDNHATRINANLLPTPEQAVNDYRLNGGHITDPVYDINDPLFNNQERSDLRYQKFTKRFPSLANIFYGIVNENDATFIEALHFFIDLTYRLSMSV